MSITSQLAQLNDELERRTMPGLEIVRSVGSELQQGGARPSGFVAGAVRSMFGLRGPGRGTTGSGQGFEGTNITVSGTGTVSSGAAEALAQLFRDERERSRAEFELRVLQNQGLTRLITPGQREDAQRLQERIAELLAIIANNTSGNSDRAGGGI